MGSPLQRERVREDGRGIKGDRAGVVVDAGVEFEPAAWDVGKGDGTGGLTFLHHGSDQEITSEEEVVGLLEEGIIEAEHRIDDGFASLCRQVGQGVEERNEPVTQPDHVSDDVGDPRIHPRFVDRSVVMPGVDGESRVHDAVGHPAGEELGAGASGAGETADIVAEIHQAGHAHPHAHPGVVPQGAPGGGIVTTPGLDVALQPERSGPGDEEGALAGSGLALGLVGGAIHEQGLHRTDPVEFHRVTKTGSSDLGWGG